MKKRSKKKENPVNDDVDTVREDDPETSEAPAETVTPAPEAAEDIPEAAISEVEEPGEAESGDAALDALARERDALQDQLLRARAEFDNYRKRMARESEQVRKTAAQGLMRDLLPIMDNLERALNHADDKNGGFAQGVEMILKQFAGVLQAQGLEPIHAVGKPFDPNFHEALTYQPSAQYPAEHVMEEFQRGYQLGDYVLRPSQVIVSSGAPVATPEKGEEPAAADAGEQPEAPEKQ